jgi:hypothetical protein
VTWEVSTRHDCGHWSTAEVREGLIVTPEACAWCEREPAPQRPSRLRVWWEARRMRAWLRGLRGADDLA